MIRNRMLILPVAAAVSLFVACSDEDLNPVDIGEPALEVDVATFRDVTATHLPNGLGGASMDAAVADVDRDGDLDLLVAQEFAPNVLLLNDGSGRFSNASDRLPTVSRDSEDIAVADFDLDGYLDVVVVSEDDQTNEFYLNTGSGSFIDAGSRIPVRRITNAVVAADLTGDGAPDLILGNAGPNVFLRNDGAANFFDESEIRLPLTFDRTQDVELGDVDGDGDLDLLVGNENGNRLLINDGSGRFADESEARIPMATAREETREADFGDIDGDGDLDILFANVRSSVPSADPANRLLLNDGSGTFIESVDLLPRDQDRSFDGDLFDLDGDGDLDILTSNLNRMPGEPMPALWIVYLNDGGGTFMESTSDVFPNGIAGFGLDAEFADFDGDGRLDLYLASRGSRDQLLLGIR